MPSDEPLIDTWRSLVRPMTVFLILVAVGTGSLLAIQAGINAQLRLRTGDAIQAAMISTAVSTISLLLLTIARHKPFAPFHQLSDGPWWIWIGGVLGAAIVTLTLLLISRLGGAVFFGSTVLGQLLAALVIDQYGLFGVQQHSINAPRVAGAAMLVGGVILIRAF
jgi:transporter family-2 protein